MGRKILGAIPPGRLRTAAAALALFGFVVAAGCDGRGPAGSGEPTATPTPSPTPSPTPGPPGARVRLDQVRFFAYQLQGLDASGAIDSLADSRYDLVVLEPTRSDKEMLDFDTAGMVGRLHASSAHDGTGGKLVLAYVDVGEAEDWRWYWGDDWVAPTSRRRGVPDFLIAPDPDGWTGNYPVTFWDPRWKKIVIGSPGSGSALDQVLSDGFDGIYMDWIEAFSDPAVAAEAARQGVDPALEMVRFIAEIRDTARARQPGFLVVAQNATDLADGHPDYYSVIDGIGQEDLSFGGEADVGWLDSRAGDVRTAGEDREQLKAALAEYRKAGVKVLTIDYARKAGHRDEAYGYSLAQGFVPFVSLTPLDRLPSWVPPGY